MSSQEHLCRYPIAEARLGAVIQPFHPTSYHRIDDLSKVCFFRVVLTNQVVVVFVDPAPTEAVGIAEVDKGGDYLGHRFVVSKLRLLLKQHTDTKCRKTRSFDKQDPSPPLPGLQGLDAIPLPLPCALKRY